MQLRRVLLKHSSIFQLFIALMQLRRVLLKNSSLFQLFIMLMQLKGSPAEAL